MKKASQSQIDQFLSVKRLAVIGVSRSEKQYSRMLFRELLKQGYDALPVNPQVDQIDGKTCHKSIKDIAPVPDRAAVVLPKDKVEQAVLECADAGVKEIWVLPIGSGSAAVQELAKQKGVNLIAGECMFMFLPNAIWVHRLHGTILKILRKYPR